MQLPNHYGYGQLFVFSGLDGATRPLDDFAGMIMEEPISIRFHFNNPITLSLPIKEKIDFKLVSGDVIDFEVNGKAGKVVFMDAYTVSGISPVKPVVFTEEPSESKTRCGVEHILIRNEETEFTPYFENKFAFAVKKVGENYLFNFHFFGLENVPMKKYNVEEIEAVCARNYAYFDTITPCKDERFEKLYYKCISINKENVYSPILKCYNTPIPCRWTTPDRIPHRNMWLWDSIFHAFAFLQYNEEMAKEAIYAVLAMQKEDGFIAHTHRVQHEFQSEYLQPPVLAWGVWNIYLKTKDKEYLEKCATPLKKFLLWIMKNRDKNGNGLVEWKTNPELNCKCDESGLDNSPRFDFDQELDAIDFSTYLANDCKYLAKIFEELGDKESAQFFADYYTTLKDKINGLLWDEEDGLYYDRLFNGKLTKVRTASSFLPLLAGIASQEQAEKLVKVMTDEKEFGTAMPIPSIAKSSPLYDIDMWRGCTWLNINYFTILSLRRYGYVELANEMREKVLASVNHWYKETGNIFEFYDADGKINPFALKRKGDPILPPDYRKHMHSITDYNWSACFIELMINEVYVD